MERAMEVESSSSEEDEEERPQTPATAVVGDTENNMSQSSQVNSRNPSPVIPFSVELEPQKEQIESPCKKPRLDDDDDGSLCPICLDNWTTTGEHRICSLKCGHLFGLSCLNRWINSQTKKTCPTCKKKVVRSEIR